MLTGKRQPVDSVFVKANAALGSIKEKAIMEDAMAFTNQLKEEQSEDKHDNNQGAGQPNESWKANDDHKKKHSRTYNRKFG